MANKNKIKLDISNSVTHGEGQHVTAWFDTPMMGLSFFHVHNGDIRMALRMAVRARMFMRYGINPKVAEALAQTASSLRGLANSLEDLRVRNHE